MPPVARRLTCRCCRAYAGPLGYCQRHRAVYDEQRRVRARIVRERAMLANGLSRAEQHVHGERLAQLEARMALLTGDQHGTAVWGRMLGAGEAVAHLHRRDVAANAKRRQRARAQH